MTNQVKINLLREELSDLNKLIENETKLVKKFQNDIFLKLTLESYITRQNSLQEELENLEIKPIKTTTNFLPKKTLKTAV